MKMAEKIKQDLIKNLKVEAENNSGYEVRDEPSQSPSTSGTTANSQFVVNSDEAVPEIKTNDKVNEIDDNSSIASCNDSVEELCKKQKLSQCFNKLNSKVKKRNYRYQKTPSDGTDSSDDNQENNTCKNNSKTNVNELKQKKQEESNEDSDDSESSSKSSLDLSDMEENGCNEWTSPESEDETNEPAVLLKKPSKSKWTIKEIIKRQIGVNPLSFVNDFYGSLTVVQKLELMYKLEGHNRCVNALNFNSKGNLLVSASDDLRIVIWDWAKGKKLKTIKTQHSSNVFQSKWLPLDIETFIVTAARDGQVRLIDICKNTSQKLGTHRGACHKVTTFFDYPYLVISAGEDAKVLSIDTRDSKATRLTTVQETHPIKLYSVHSNPLNSNEICVAGESYQVRIYDRRNPEKPLKMLYPNRLANSKYKHITSAVYNYNGTEIVASYNNDDIYLFDTLMPRESGDFAHRYQGHRNSLTIKGVNFFGPKSEYIVSGSDCGNIFFWDKKTEAIVQWMHGDEQGIVNVLEPHPHIPVFATSGLDFDVKIWVPSREEDPDFKKSLKTCVKRNLSTKSSKINSNDAFDSHVLWIMLRHLDQQNISHFQSDDETPSDNLSEIDGNTSFDDSELGSEDSNDINMENQSSHEDDSSEETHDASHISDNS